MIFRVPRKRWARLAIRLITPAGCILIAGWANVGILAQCSWEPLPGGGWLAVDVGWEEPVEVAPWGGCGFAVGLNVYNALGNSEPQLLRVDLEGVQAACVLAPEGTVGGLAADAAGGVWVVWNEGAPSTTSPSGSVQTTALAYFPPALPNEQDTPLPAAGPVHCPWATPWMKAEAVVATEDGGALVVGWGLDPCCAHRELPFFWKVRADGSPDAAFGWGGISVVDVAGETAIRPPGNTAHEAVDTPAERHDVGGFFSSVTATNGGWVAGGGYSNGSAYELMLVRVVESGQLDTAFGETGVVRLNAFPGMSHHVVDVSSREGTFVSLVAVPPNAESESGCVVWSVLASGESAAWDEAPLSGFQADRWEKAHGELWAIGLLPEQDHLIPAGIPWVDGFGTPSVWPLNSGSNANRVRTAWHPDYAILATAVQTSANLSTESAWGFRAWTPWARDMLHR